MNSPTDQQLLRDYAERRSEAAFAEIVRRHVDLVYSAALRMVRDAHLAEDATQGVFAALARSAGQLTDRPVLSGWLHRTARNLSASAVRAEARRRVREQEAAAMNESPTHESDSFWEQIAPQLDAALGELNEADRDAVLLRYFERKSAPEMAQILGVTEEAAQKRVSRAVERLRELFSKHNITIGAGGLAVLISANAVQSAPIGLAVTVSTAALAGTVVSSSAVIAATKTVAMTTLQKVLVTATVTVLAGAGIYEAHQASRLSGQVQTLQQRHAPLAEQVRQLLRERDDATNRLAAVEAENAQLQSDQNGPGLLKLRGEVGALKRQLAETANTDNSQDGRPVWTPQQLSNVGRATAPDALQTLLWAGHRRNYEEISNSIIPDVNGPQPDAKSLEDFVKDISKLGPGIYSYSVSATRKPGPGEMKFDVVEDLRTSRWLVTFTFRKTDGEWKAVVFNTPAAQGKRDLDFEKPRLPLAPLPKPSP